MPTMRQPGYARLDSSATPDGGEGGQRGDEIAELQRLVRKLEREVAAAPEVVTPAACTAAESS